MQPLIPTEPEIRQRIWMELARAVHDRHHEWRTPVLATVGENGIPNARTVVLRHANAGLQCLQFYTDRRSPKIADLTHQPAATLVFWSKRLSWQLRVSADMAIQTLGPEVDAVWGRVSQSAAAGDYLSHDAPGTALPSGQAAAGNATHSQPDTQTHTHTHHLAILSAHVRSIDWLELSRSGHRRAVWNLNAWEWRVP